MPPGPVFRCGAAVLRVNFFLLSGRAAGRLSLATALAAALAAALATAARAVFERRRWLELRRGTRGRGRSGWRDRGVRQRLPRGLLRGVAPSAHGRENDRDERDDEKPHACVHDRVRRPRRQHAPRRRAERGEPRQDFPRRLRSIGGRLGEQIQNETGERRRRGVGQGRRRFHELAREDLRGKLRFEGRMPGDHFVHHHAERVEIGAPVERAVPSPARATCTPPCPSRRPRA